MIRLVPEIVHPEPDAVTPQSVTVHFHGGTKASTLLTDVDLENFNDLTDDEGEEVRDFEELIEKTIENPPRPHWCWIGGIYLFTQAISGIELADTTDQ